MKQLVSLFLLVSFLNACGSNNNYAVSADQTTQPQDFQIGKIEAAIQSVQGLKSAEERASVAANAFMGTSYAGGPLGEGEKAPLYRGDAFDCTTLVETVLAVINSKSLDQFKQMMNIVRYKNGEVSFITRNHFADADWIKNNQALGFFKEITSDVANAGSVTLQTSTAHIDRKSWFKAFHSVDTSFAPEEVKLPYLAISDLFVAGDDLTALVKTYGEEEGKFIARIKAETDVGKQLAIRDEWRSYVASLDLSKVTNAKLLAAIPSGSIVNLVTPGWVLSKDNQAITGMNIGHQGMVFKNNGRLVVRDASSTWRKVSELPLENYFFIKLTNKLQKGMNFLKIEEFSGSK